jgi:NADH-quinone oxidoreductase subunit G
LNCENVPKEKLEGTFVIYQGHHGDKGASLADVVLPGLAFTEKDATYVNTGGRVQRTNKAIHPLGEAKEDWKIITSLSHFLQKVGLLDSELYYSSLNDLRRKIALDKPHFYIIEDLPDYEQNIKKLKALNTVSFQKEDLMPSITNFYQTNVITRYSKLMQEATRSQK